MDINTNSLKQLEKESDTAYLSFLLFGIQTSNRRSNRKIARLMKCSEGSVRYWKTKYAWLKRLDSCPQYEYVCIEIFRQIVSESKDDEKMLLEKALEVILNDAPSTLRAYIRRQSIGVTSIVEAIENSNKAKEEVKGEAPLGQKIKEKYLTEKDISRQIKLIDAAMGMIVKKVQSGDIKASIKDIPSLIKARALLTGLPTQHIHVTSKSEVHVTESQRVQLIKNNGTYSESQIIDAMYEDVNELSVIIDAVKSSNKMQEKQAINLIEKKEGPNG